VITREVMSMKLDDVKKALKNAKYIHLTDDTLISYRDQILDEISRSQVDAHLDLCLICKRRLSVFQEEYAAFYGDGKPTPPAGNPLLNRFAEYLRRAAADWDTYFAQLQPVRGSKGTGYEVWRYEDKAQGFVAYARVEPTADLTLHFSSRDTGLEGERLTVRVGSVTEGATFQHVSKSEVRADVTVPRRKRPRNLKDISFEMV
jgi:hypothetical protein